MEEAQKYDSIFANIELGVKQEYHKERFRIENELKDGMQTRQSLAERIQFLGIEAEKERQRRWMLLEEVDGWVREQSELIVQKEDLEMSLAALGSHNDRCSIELANQNEIETLLKQSEASLKEKRQEQASLQEEISEILATVKRVELEHKTIKGRIGAGLRLRDEKMKKVKRELEILLETFSNACRLENVPAEAVGVRMREIVGHIGRGIEVEILREQIKAVQVEEDTLRAGLANRSDELREALRHAGDLRSHELETRVERFAVQHAAKCIALAEWRANLRSLLQANTGDGEYRATYNLFLEGRLEHLIQRELSRKINWSDTYQDKLDQLLKLLDTYAEAAGTKGKEFLKEKKVLEDVEAQLMAFACRKELCTWMVERLQAGISRLEMDKLVLDQELSEVNLRLEALVNEEVERRSGLLEKANQDNYKWLQRTYGSKAADRQRFQDRSDILKKVVREKKDLLASVSSTKQSKEKIEKRINDCHHHVHSSILPLVSELEERVKQITAVQHDLVLRDQQLVETEEDVFQMLAVIEHKESRELSHRMSLVQEEVTKQQDLLALIADTDRAIESRQKKIDGLEFELKKLDDAKLSLDRQVCTANEERKSRCSHQRTRSQASSRKREVPPSTADTEREMPVSLSRRKPQVDEDQKIQGPPDTDHHPRCQQLRVQSDPRLSPVSPRSQLQQRGQGQRVRPERRQEAVADIQDPDQARPFFL